MWSKYTTRFKEYINKKSNTFRKKFEFLTDMTNLRRLENNLVTAVGGCREWKACEGEGLRGDWSEEEEEDDEGVYAWGGF